MRYAGIVASGNPNSSQEIDDIVYDQKSVYSMLDYLQELRTRVNKPLAQERA